MANRPTGISFRLRLLGLVMLAVVPALGLILYTAHEDRARAKNDAENQIRMLQENSNQNVSGEVSRAASLLETVKSVLATLGETASSSSPDMTCGRVLAGLGPQLEQYAELLVVDAGGAVTCTARPIVLSNATSIDAIRTTLATGQPALGNYATDPIVGKPVTFLASPVMRDGKAVAAVAVAFDLDFFNTNSTLGDSPKDTILSVVDRNGILLVQVPPDAGQVGGRLPDARLVARIRSQEKSAIAELDGPGGHRIYSYARLNIPDATAPYVVVSRSSSEILADANFAQLRNLVGLAIVAILGIGAAFFIDYFFSRRVGQLLRGTRAVAAGDLSVRVPEAGGGELGDLAHSFNEMTAELSLNRRQMQDKEAQFRAVFEAAADGLTINDPDTGVIVEANTAACMLVGAPRDQVVGQHPSHFMAAADVPALARSLRSAPGGGYRQRATLIRADGTRFPADLSGTPVQFAGRRHVMTILRDVSGQVEAERILEQRVAERSKELATLLDVARSVTSILELQPLLRLILEQLHGVLPYEGAAVAAYEGEELRILESRHVLGAGEDDAFALTGMHMHPPAESWALLRSGAPIVIDDIRGESAAAVAFRTAVGEHLDTAFGYVRSWLAVPLMPKGQPVGFLSVGRDVPDSFTREHVELASAFASAAAIALENARLFSRSEEKAAENETLARLAASFALSQDLQEILDTVATTVATSAGAVSADVVLVRDGHVLQSGHFGQPEGYLQMARAKLEQGAPSPMFPAMEEQTSRVYRHAPESLQQFPEWAEAAAIWRERGWETYVITPVVYGGKSIGAMNAFFPAHDEPGDDRIAFLRAIADQAAVAIQNTRLFSRSQRKAAENATLARLAAGFTLARGVQETIEAIAREAVAATGAAAADVTLVEGDMPSLTGAVGLPAGYVEAAGRALGAGAASPLAIARGDGQPRIFRHAREMVKKAPNWGEVARLWEKTDWQAMCITPVSYRSAPIGSLTTYYRAGDAPDDDGLAFLAAIADQAAVGIENARLFEQTQQRAKENAALAAIAANITLQQPIQQTMEAITAQAVSATRAIACTISLPVAEGADLYLIGGTGLPEGFIETARALPPNVTSTAVRERFGGDAATVRDLRRAVGGAEAFRPMLPFLEQMDADTLVIVPLRYGEQTPGILNVYFATGVKPSEHETHVLDAIADQAAVAIENVRLFNQTEQRSKENAALAAVATSLTLDEPMGVMLNALSRSVVEAVGAEACAVFLSTAPGSFSIAGGYRLPDWYLESALSRPDSEESIRSTVMRTGQTLLLPSIKQRMLSNSANAERVDRIEALPWRAGAGIPLRYHNRILGVMIVPFDRDELPRADEVRLLEAVANQAAVAIENARLFTQTEQRAQQNAALASIAARVSLAQPIRVTLDGICEEVVLATGGSACAAFLEAGEPGRMSMAGSVNVPQSFADAAEVTRTIGSLRRTAMDSGDLVVVRNYTKKLLSLPEYDAIREELLQLHWDTGYVLPIASRGVASGALVITYPGRREPSPEERVFLLAIAAQAGVAIENARLFDEAERSARENAALAAIAANISINQPLRTTLDAIGETIVSSTRGLACMISAVDPETGAPILAGGARLPDRLIELNNASTSRGGSLRAAALVAEGPVITRGMRELLASREAMAPIADAIRAVEWDTAITLPVVYGGHALGAIQVGYSAEEEPRAEEIRFLEAIGDQVAIALENARLFREAERRAEENAALAAIAADAALDRPLRETLDAVAATIIGSTGSLACVISALDPVSGRTLLAGAAGLPAGFAEQVERRAYFNDEALNEDADTVRPRIIEHARDALLLEPAMMRFEAELRAAHWDTVLVVLARYGQHSVGRLRVGYPADAPPDAQEVRLLEAIADEVAIILQNAQLLGQAEQRVLENAALASIASEVALDQPMRDTLDAIATRVVAATNAIACGVFLVDEGLTRIMGGAGFRHGFLEAARRTVPESEVFTIEALRSGRHQLVPDARQRMAENPTYAAMREELLAEPWEAVLIVPIVYRGQPLGALNLGYAAGAEVPQAEEDLVRAIANQAGVAIENMRLFEQSELRVTELEALSRIAASLTLVQPIESTLETLTRTVVEATIAAGCSVVLFDPESLDVTLLAGSGLPQSYLDGLRASYSDPIWESGLRAFHSENVVVSVTKDEILADPRYAALHGAIREVPWDVCVIVPLRYKNEMIGGLNAYFEPGYHADARMIDLLQAVADQASVAVENTRLYDEANQRAREQETLAAIVADLMYDRPLRDVLDTLAANVVRGTRALACAVLIPGDDSSRLAIGEYGMPEGYMQSMIQARREYPEFWTSMNSLPETTVLLHARDYVRSAPAYEPVRHFMDEVEWDTTVRIPFAYRDSARGQVIVYLPGGPKPTASELRFFEAIAAQTSVAVENARLFEAVQDRTRELSALYRADEELHRSLKLEDVLQALLTVVKDTMSATDAVVILWEEGAARPRLITATGSAIPGTPGVIDRVVDSLTVQGREHMVDSIVRNAIPHGIEDTSQSNGPHRERTFDVGVRSVLEVGLMSGGAHFGLLDAIYSKQRRFTPEEKQLFGSLARRAALAIENAQLYEQAQALAAVEERQRLARELHDSVSQALYGIALGARTARTLLDRDPAKAIDPMDYVLSLAEAGLAEMRALIFELRPESLAQEGIVAALEKQIASTRARYGVAVDASLCGEPDIPLPVKEAFYRVGQEALHNVVKHARATHVDLLLCHQDGVLTLDLKDNGQGFDPTGDFPGHLGLKSMQERIARVGGHFAIESAPGQGAHLTAILDLDTDR